MGKQQKTKMYRFEDRSRYGQGIMATVSGAVSLILFLSTMAISMVMAGRAPSWIGVLGFIGFIFGFFGMAAGLMSFRDRNQSYTLSKVGTLMGGFMVAAWFLVFCLGFSF